MVKGAGCDNVSAIAMLPPTGGRDAIVDMVVSTINRAGPNASPPVTVGVGVGGLVTALAVHVEAGAMHIAQLPVAVNVDCHSHRVGRVTL